MLGRNLNASVALWDAVVERSDEEGRMRIAGILVLFTWWGTNVGHIELLSSNRLGVIRRCQEDVIRTIRSWRNLLELHEQRANIDKLLRLERVSAANDQRHCVTWLHVNCRFILAERKINNENNVMFFLLKKNCMNNAHYQNQRVVKTGQSGLVCWSVKAKSRWHY